MSNGKDRRKGESRKDELARLEAEQRKDGSDIVPRDSRTSSLDEAAGDNRTRHDVESGAEFVPVAKGQRDKTRVWTGYDFGDLEAGPAADGQKFLTKPPLRWVSIEPAEQRLFESVQGELARVLERPNRRVDDSRWRELVNALTAADDILHGRDLHGWDKLLERAIVGELERRKEDEMRANHNPPLPTEATPRTGRDILEWLQFHAWCPDWLTPAMIDTIWRQRRPPGGGERRRAPGS